MKSKQRSLISRLDIEGYIKADSAEQKILQSGTSTLEFRLNCNCYYLVSISRRPPSSQV